MLLLLFLLIALLHDRHIGEGGGAIVTQSYNNRMVTTMTMLKGEEAGHGGGGIRWRQRKQNFFVYPSPRYQHIIIQFLISFYMTVAVSIVSYSKCPSLFIL